MEDTPPKVDSPPLFMSRCHGRGGAHYLGLVSSRPHQEGEDCCPVPVTAYWDGVVPTQLPQTHTAPPHGVGHVQLFFWGTVREPGDKPHLPRGGFYVWTGLQGTNDMEAYIAASDADMAALDGRNTQADQIVRTTRMVLQVIVIPLTMQREVGTCF